MALNPVTTALLIGQASGGTLVPVLLNPDGSVVTGGAVGLTGFEYQMEDTFTAGAGAVFADIDLLPTMKLCPDLTAPQLGQADADYKLVALSITTETPGQVFEISRDALLGAGGTKTTLSTAAGVTVLDMRYSGSTVQRTIAVAAPGAAVTYQVQVTFSVAAP